MKRRHVAVDIECLGTPENSGYDIIIPNYAVVMVPSKPTHNITNFFYVKQPYQAQVNAGLKSDASAMSFWMNKCAKEYPGAYEEVASTMDLATAEIYTSNGKAKKIFPNDLIAEFWDELRYHYGEEVPHSVWGNGCHFDCSILEANHRKLYGKTGMWSYDAPDNARTIKRLLNDAARQEMDEIVALQLPKFVQFAEFCDVKGLELHHPLFDAAREAIQISYCLNKLKLD